jgi:hypothetical protein
MPKLCPIVRYVGGKKTPKRVDITHCQLCISLKIVRAAGMEVGDVIEYVVMKPGLIGLRKVKGREWDDEPV